MSDDLGGAAPRIGRRAVLGGLLALAVGCDRGAKKGWAEQRVVSISPSTTEAAYAVGAGTRLVGRSKQCDYPAAVTSLPIVGGFADPSLEAIIALAPTLVIGAHGPAGPALEQALGARGIATFFPETESIAQIESMLAELGKKLSGDVAARVAIAAIEARRAEVARAIAGKPRVKAALLFDVSPIVAAGPGSFPDELLREAGGDNVITAGGAYPTINLERLLALDPDLVLDGAGDMNEGASRIAALREAPGWRDLRALREGRVRSLSVATALRPGPRIGEGLVAMARAIHGDLRAIGATPAKAP